MPATTAPLAETLAESLAALTGLCPGDGAALALGEPTERRHRVIADTPAGCWARAEALALGSAGRQRVALVVADAAAVDARLAVLGRRDLGGLRLLGVRGAVAADGRVDEAQVQEERVEEERALVTGAFDLLVITIDRLGQLLRRAPSLADDLGLVIVEGADALVDPLESARWDHPLTLLRLASLPPRLVALVDRQGPAAAAIAGWLDAAVDPGGPPQLALHAGAVAASGSLASHLPLEPLVLALLGGGHAGHIGELRAALLASFAGSTAYRRLAAAGEPSAGFTALLEDALAACIAAGALTYRQGHGLVATAAGRRGAGLGVDLATLGHLDRWVASLEGRGPSLLELSLELARTPAAAAAPLPPGGPAIDYRALALAAAEALGIASRPVFVWLRSDLTGRSAAAAAALRRATVLLGLLQDQPRDDLRTHHGATAGLLRDLAATLLRPLLATVALAREHGRPTAEVELLGRAARRLDPGPTRTSQASRAGRPSHSSPPSHLGHPGHPGHPGHAGHAGRDQPRRPPHAPSQPSRPAAVDPAGRRRSPRPATRQICLFAEA